MGEFPMIAGVTTHVAPKWPAPTAQPDGDDHQTSSQFQLLTATARQQSLGSSQGGWCSLELWVQYACGSVWISMELRIRTKPQDEIWEVKLPMLEDVGIQGPLNIFQQLDMWHVWTVNMNSEYHTRGRWRPSTYKSLYHSTNKLDFFLPQTSTAIGIPSQLS